MTADVDPDFLSSACVVARRFGRRPATPAAAPPRTYRCRTPAGRSPCHTATGPVGGTSVDLQTTPPDALLNDYDEYARLAREATARGDHTTAVDNRVRTHDTGHAGTP